MFKQGKAFLRIISYLQRLKGILFTITHLYTLFPNSNFGNNDSHVLNY